MGQPRRRVVLDGELLPRRRLLPAASVARGLGRLQEVAALRALLGRGGGGGRADGQLVRRLGFHSLRRLRPRGRGHGALTDGLDGGWGRGQGGVGGASLGRHAHHFLLLEVFLIVGGKKRAQEGKKNLFTRTSHNSC